MAVNKTEGSVGTIDTDLPQADWKAIGRRIRNLRGKTLNQIQLAKYLGVSQGHISDVEQGYAEMGVIPMLWVAKMFNTTVEWLVLGDPESPNESALQEASELLSKNFVRPAGLVAGNVLEAELSKLSASAFTDFINMEFDAHGLNEKLHTFGKREQSTAGEMIAVLNACRHGISKQPTAEQVRRLIGWVRNLVTDSGEASYPQTVRTPRIKRSPKEIHPTG